MLTQIVFSNAPHGPAETPPNRAPQLSRWNMHPTGPLIEAPPISDRPEETAGAEVPADEAMPPAEMPEPGPPRRPPWIRVLIILAFFLFPIISSFLRNWSSFRNQPEQPVLREIVISESVPEGSELRPRNVFSLHRDREVFFSSKWTGQIQGHGFVLSWLEPAREGTAARAVRNGSAVKVQADNNDDSAFSVSGSLTLDPAMQVGEWEVRLQEDGQLRGRAKFELQN